MDKHPIQGGVAILSVASCYRNWDRLRPCGPPWLVYDFTFTLLATPVINVAKLKVKLKAKKKKFSQLFAWVKY